MENEIENLEVTTTEQTSAVAKYDGRAEQRIEFKIKRGNKIYKVAHILKSPSDADLLEYEKRRNVRLREADKSELGEAGISTNDDSFAAAVALWNKLAVSVEGYRVSDDWREKVRETDKFTVITENLLAVEVLDELLEETSEELLDEDEIHNARTIELRSMFAGREILTSHDLRSPSAAELKRYRTLMATNYTVKGQKMRSSDIRVPSRAKDLANFYDNLLIESKGYVEDIVPLHHKMTVTIDHFGREQETLSGN